MNKKIKLTILGILALVGLFAGVNTTLAGRAPVVTCNSATIYGSVWPSGGTVDAWLEWGNNANTVQNGGGSRVGFQSVSSNTEISATLTGLIQNTTYYYRMAVQDGPDYIPATTENFTTPACPIVNTPVNGGWSDWSPKDNTCGISGTQTRTCTNPAPANGGAYCVGPSTQTYTNAACEVSIPTIPSGISAYAVSKNQINVSWGPSSGGDGSQIAYNIYRCTGAGCTPNANNYIGWGYSTSYQDTGLSCDTTYGYNIRAYDSHPSFSNFSSTSWATTLTCDGIIKTPINGGWSDWSPRDYSCGTSGVQVRTCTNPAPANGGAYCVGPSTQTYTNAACGGGGGDSYPINGGWSDWSTRDYSCGTSGVQVRTCTNPAPANGGAYCVGPSTQTYTNAACGGGGTVYDCSYYGTCYINQNRQPLVTTYPATVLTTNSAILNGYIDSNGSYVTRWFEWGTTYYYLGNITNKAYQSYGGNFNETIYNLNPNTTYYYRAAAQSNNGQIVYGNTATFTTTSGGTYYGTCTYGTCTPTAITTMATNIGGASARVNGIGLVTNGVATTGYFEYGTTQTFGNTTNSKNIGSTSSNPFYESLFNLASNTIYYYRAVVVNQYGTSRGDIMSFRTGNPIVYTNTNTNTNTIYRNTTVVTNNTTGTSRPSLVLLTVSRDGEGIKKGSVVEYIVNYKNVSSKKLENIILQIYIPKELEFIETSRGTFSTENSTVVANIGNLNSQEEGNVRVSVKVADTAEINKTIVVTANLAYTITDTKTQEEVFAYSKNTIEEGRTSVQQGALAFLFGNSFLPNTLLGWLLLILLIVLVVLAARKAYYGKQPVTVVSDTHK